MAINWTKIFTDIGAFARCYNKFKTDVRLNLLDAEMSNKISALSEDAAARDLLTDALQKMKGYKAQAESWMASEKSILDSCLATIVRPEIASGQSQVGDLIDDLSEAMAREAQSVKANSVTAFVDSNDDLNQLSNWNISGANWTNVDFANGRLYAYVRYTGGSYYVSLYRDVNLIAKVAEGSRATPEGAVTLSPVNASGLSGAVTLDYSSDDPDIQLQVLPAPDADNIGTGDNSVSMAALTQMANSETWTLECIGAKNASAPSRWEVRGSLSGRLNSNLSADSEYTSPAGEFSLRVNDPDTSVITEVNDQSNQFSAWTLSGVSAENCWRGRLYSGVGASYKGHYFVTLGYDSGVYSVKLYKGENQQEADLVASGSRATATGVVTLSAQNNSGLSGSVTINYTADDADIFLFFDLPHAVGDRYVFTAASDDAGVFQTFFRNVYRKVLPSAPSGMETISDALAQ